MQRRLLISMLAVAIAAVLALGIPLGYVLGRLQVDDATRSLQQNAQDLATGLYNHSRGGTVTPTYAAEQGRALSGRYVVIRQIGKTQPLARTGAWPGHGDYRSASVTAGKGPFFTVTVYADDSYLSGNLTKELLLVGGVALAAVGVAAVLGLLYARRMTRPLEELARAADRLGLGDTGSLGRRYGIQELDRVAEGLDSSAQRINDMMSAERDFAVDASHQLRTPLTALSMRLEEMMAAADYPDVVREEGAAALAQTERLADVVGQLLGRARRTSNGSPTVASVDDIVGQQVVEWEPAFRRVNRRLAVAGEKGLLAYATPGGAAQVIATLLDNALVHGAGTVTIRTSRTRRSVVIEVRDEGSGVPAELAPRIFERSVSGSPNGTGLGLALARTIAATDGGQVVLVRPRPAVFALFLPHATVDAEELPAVAGPA
ncbi:MAG: HAMP domain-containing histidine kinase [Actinobacteria bacterium]|nr:HAMP domain-containing histidine kinase [Actinomycetota bacterium]MBO0835160.1 HAMP domain-containing histidine kinase [Actinomycetota bacterium]